MSRRVRVLTVVLLTATGCGGERAGNAFAVRDSAGDLEQRRQEAMQFDTVRRRMRLSSLAFRENVAAAPVLIIPCLVKPTSPTSDVDSLFADDVVPLFAAHGCLVCHGALGGLTLTGTPAEIHAELQGLVIDGTPEPKMERPIAMIPPAINTSAKTTPIRRMAKARSGVSAERASTIATCPTTAAPIIMKRCPINAG